VVVAGLYRPEKIPEQDRLPVEEMVREINRLARNERAVYIARTDEIPPYVAAESKAGDVIIVMSNGGFGGVQERILRALKSRAA
jgi:UDP-N-acetylmuramate: L-alanyl-gamma-D-glutamyl-meso-diaminopimelate ligase